MFDVWSIHIDCRHLWAVVSLDTRIVHSASRLLALQAVALRVVFTALVVHILISFILKLLYYVSLGFEEFYFLFMKAVLA